MLEGNPSEELKANNRIDTQSAVAKLTAGGQVV